VARSVSHHHVVVLTLTIFQIDFDAMMQQERAMATKTPTTLKFTTVQDVYNGLQRKPSDGGARMLLSTRGPTCHSSNRGASATRN